MIHIKSKTEIVKMRDACKLAREVLHETARLALPGKSTQEINDFAEKYTRKHGAVSAPLNYRGFPKSICTSINNVVCHGIPDKDAILKNGDIINIDVTVKLNGYHGDTSMMVAVGEIDEEAENLIKNTEKAMYTGINAIKPSGRISDIGNAIDDFLTPLGYGIVRDLTGHGIGRNFHEEPTVPHYRQTRINNIMRPGMIFTVEPMVNTGRYEVVIDDKDGWTVTTADGSLSAQFEHTCLVTDNGYEILTDNG